MKTFIIRAASALVGIFIVWASYRFGGVDALAILASITAVVFAVEFSNLLPGGKTLQWAFTLLIVALIYIGIFAPELFVLELGLSFVLTALVILSRVGKKLSIDEAFHQMSFYGFGLLYCAILPLFIFHMIYSEDGIKWFVLYLTMVFIGDTGAYLVGMLAGKNKLLEVVSPKKSVEGAFGGLACTVATALLAQPYFDVPHYQLAICALAVGCVAQAGDLVESLLKRAVQVKDSGKLMPGHGGMMDRLDGIYFASPVFYWFLRMWTDT